MDLSAYLDRIGYKGPVAVDLATLRGMHRAHWLTTPFENLNIQRGVPIVVDPRRNYDKIVRMRRGGFCLELTGLFAWALREIGFTVNIHGGRMLSPNGVLSPPLSHMVLTVEMDEPWVVDVGAGGRIPGPLRLQERTPQEFGVRAFTVANDDDHWLVTMDEPWTGPAQPRTYVFTRQPREYEEFHDVCQWLQTSPDSAFTHGDIVTLATDGGRTTYSAGRLIVSGDLREESEIPPDRRAAVLAERFGIVIDEPPGVAP